MTESEDVIGEAGGIGVVLLDPQLGLVIKQSMEHMHLIPHSGVCRRTDRHMLYRRGRHFGGLSRQRKACGRAQSMRLLPRSLPQLVWPKFVTARLREVI